VIITHKFTTSKNFQNVQRVQNIKKLHKCSIEKINKMRKTFSQKPNFQNIQAFAHIKYSDFHFKMCKKKILENIPYIAADGGNVLIF